MAGQEPRGSTVRGIKAFLPKGITMLTNKECEKVKKLPTWARDLIKRLEYASLPMIEEAATQRRKALIAEVKAKRLEDANSALLELLGKAGEAGLDWAKIVVSVLEGYEIFHPVADRVEQS